MTDYEPVIGLEIHVQLSTKTKMFCGCELSFGDEPNVHTCPVCLGHPGTLPVTNEQAIEYGLKIAAALGCEVAPRSIFHRKNYFYPDLPKGYQISQFDIPLGSGGNLGDVRIHRIHLEEDAAKLTHVGGSGRIHGSGASEVDFNRGGTPLVEIVTEPDIRSAAQAREWLTLLRTTVKRIGVSNVNMEEGSLRCDANVSVRPVGTEELGTKAELKNMNSFRYIEKGVEAEIRRQVGIVEGGGEVTQATMHFDPSSGQLTMLRSKEFAHDYRYLPEPDLVPIAPSPAQISAAADSLPELPQARRDRYAGQLGISAPDATLLAFEEPMGDYFEAVLDAAGRPLADAEPAPAALATWVISDLVRALRDADLDSEDPAASNVDPGALAGLATMVAEKTINRGIAKRVLSKLVAEGGDPAEIVEREGLAGGADADQLAPIVEAALAANPDAAEKVRDGNMKAVGPIVGAVMRETQGKADGGEINRLIREQLGI